MPFLIDPRAGDCEDDASSTDQRPLLAIAGTMLAELSLIKLAVTWLLVVAMPALVIGLTIPLLSAWLTKVSDRAAAFTGIGSVIVLSVLAAVAWFGLRPLLRLAESNFWALHSIVVQPFYTLAREGIRHVAELSLFAKANEITRAKARSAISLFAAAICVALAWMIVSITWPYTRWDANVGDLASITTWIKPAIANAIVVITAYFGMFSLISGLSDALMDQPVRLAAFDGPGFGDKVFRVAHLSDLHMISDPYGFRIESGRAGPQGNSQAERLFEEMSRINEKEPLDLIIVSGDVTDAGRSAEWAAFFDIIESYPSLLSRMLITPGNHDLNIVDRANPARLELPMSAWKRLRQMRTISALERVQGERVHVFDRKTRKIGPTLSQKLETHRRDIAAFAERTSLWGAYKLSPVWADCFPLVSLPLSPDGVGVLILNSNANANFSFTNALGLVPAEDAAALVTIIREHPQAKWIIALHHHLVEYPMRVKQFSERIGTSLINGSWLIRQLKPFSHRVIIMHGHRHVDWIGACGDLKIVSAPSTVMRKPSGAAGSFLIHSIFAREDGSIGLTPPDRVIVGEARSGESLAATERPGGLM
ncbi:MAG: metallophosphoesterase [Beijerinckiaceae bacterium]|nr:metallophosphoesterase [Beijerinckiaceae bacterium]